MKIDLNDNDAVKLLGELEGADMVSPLDITDQIIDTFGEDKQCQGDLLPWSKSHKLIQLREGEVSLWGGYNGHGKSQLLGQVAAWNMKYKPWAIASLEMPITKSIHRLVRQVAGNRNPDSNYIQSWTRWADGRLWYYDRLDSVPYQVMLGVVIYAAQELNVKHFVIDSLVKCKIGREEYDKQMQFVEKLSAIAKQFQMHIHLIHHMRKKENEEVIPSKFDFRGAGELTDLVDNVFIAYRNKRKERVIRINKATEEDLLLPDQYLKCDKQRYGEWEGLIALWFHQDSLQYLPEDNERTMANLWEAA